MEFLLTRHLWGVDLDRPRDALFAHWQERGYRAIECSLRTEQLRSFAEEAAARGWRWILDVYSDDFVTDGSVERHLASLQRQIEQADAFPAPVLINAHSGLDRWSAAEMVDFFGGALDMERRWGIPMCHETHRRRCLATPWAAELVLAHFPTLKLTADFSHWVCVTERLLQDFTAVMARATRQTWHIHARVGFEHGPQVSDPRAPEWAAQLEAHETWWQAIWRDQIARGVSCSPLTPEFGPPPYQWTLPWTGAPLASLEEICDWMAARQARLFATTADSTKR